MLAEVMQGAGHDALVVVSDSYFRRNRWRSITNDFAEVIESPAVSFDRHNSVQVTDAALSALQKKRDRRSSLGALLRCAPATGLADRD